MAKKTHDICVKTGIYEKDGETKNRYLNVGSVMMDDSGDGIKKFILMNRTFNPAGVPNPDNRESVLLSVFEAKPRDPDFWYE